MIPVKPLDRAISNIKYRLGEYYVRMGLTPLPTVRVCRDFSRLPPLPRDPYVINEWPLIVEDKPENKETRKRKEELIFIPMCSPDKEEEAT